MTRPSFGLLVALAVAGCELPDIESESVIDPDAEPFTGASPDACGSFDGVAPTMQVIVESSNGLRPCDATVIARDGIREIALVAASVVGDDASLVGCVYVGTVVVGGPYQVEITREGCEPVRAEGLVPRATACPRSPSGDVVLVTLGPECIVDSGIVDAGSSSDAGDSGPG